MPAYARRDDWVINAIGYAIPNTSVTYYVEPALTLATVYADENGVTSATNPQFTDGLGHTVAYMTPGLYTIVYAGRQIQTLTLINQSIGLGSGGSGVTAFAGVPAGTIDGVNKVFTFAVAVNPSLLIVTLNIPLIVNQGYTVSWASGTLTIVYTTAPQPPAGGVAGDLLYVQGFYES